jgi:uncharacterized protein (TIGR02679 family)
MNDKAHGRIRALLAAPAYGRLLAALRARVEDAGDAARSVTLEDTDAEQREAVAGLLGLRQAPEATFRLELERLDRAFRESAVAATLREVLEAFGGPLRDRSAERRSARGERDRMWAVALEACRAAGREDLCAWLERLRAGGGLTRAAGAAGAEPGVLLEAAVTVARALPANGELLAVFAARTAGDPHALDAGTPLGGLVLQAAAAVTGTDEAPTSAAGRRGLWHEVGIDCDALSSDVLVLGVRPSSPGWVGEQLRDSANAGEPRRLTLREVRRAGLRVETGTLVHVCENPSIVEAAADALGRQCAALVCVEGVPSTAALELLRDLAAGGARLLAHADFDWSGLRIVGLLAAVVGAQPWRMAAADYRGALHCSPGGPALGRARALSAAWDVELVPAMEEGGQAVLEEHVLAVLLDDLCCQAVLR